jgi:hypothetical protein
MKKQLSNPFSTGGGGTKFEGNIQTAFFTFMVQTMGFLS